MNTVPTSSFTFLKSLHKNNHRDWMTEHKKEYQASEKALKAFYADIQSGLNEDDEIEKLKVFRINRDVRFSKDKTPYNVHRSVSFSRAGAHRRGGYYLRLEPGGKSVVAGGFFSPEPKDLLRIRTEFQMDSSDIRDILAESAFAKAYGGKFDAWDPVKTAPKGFSKEDPNIDLIRLKNFVVTHSFTDAEVHAPDFGAKVVHHFKLLRPFFDYMSDVLTTDLNGVSLLE
ncbi:DUF2461 domain-containing protein [Dokdonia pacifica]|uniref:TIGR02453 family protein n=1 Tax=Dokdonia pacifica TaxID=1627892 RepID=A0A239D9E3_9FLAO|nr:DUF2461 domain-containing protein [Dokdonia pacifica]SNS28752.1 TIGR02453 family protein [Dokdonia pacifica]